MKYECHCIAEEFCPLHASAEEMWEIIKECSRIPGIMKFALEFNLCKRMELIIKLAED